jgi:hypothetical protein
MILVRRSKGEGIGTVVLTPNVEPRSEQVTFSGDISRWMDSLEILPPSIFTSEFAQP